MSVEGICPTIRPMSVETCSIAIAAMDDSKRCVNVGQCREALFTYVVERLTQGHPSPAARLLLPLPVPLSGAIFRSESRGAAASLTLTITDRSTNSKPGDYHRVI